MEKAVRLDSSPRLESRTYAFVYVGVDYMGPFTIKIGRQTENDEFASSPVLSFVLFVSKWHTVSMLTLFYSVFNGLKISEKNGIRY